MRRLLTLGWVGLAANLAAAQSGEVRAIRTTSYVHPVGDVREGTLIVFAEGVIRQVGGEPPAGVPVDEFDGVLSPGLIDAVAQLTAVGQLAELSTPADAELRATAAFDAFSEHLGRAARAGVTTFCLAADDSHVVGGRAAICQTGGPDGKPTVLKADGPYKLSLSPAAYLPDREPTSRSGALQMLRSQLDGGLAKKIAGPKNVALFSAPTGADVASALGFVKQHALPLSIVHNDDAADVASMCKSFSGHVSVIAGPYDFGSSRREMAAAGIFEKAGVGVALAGGLPYRGPESLRTTACLAARNGMSLGMARKAITSSAADAIGMADTLGSIEKGKRADLVVFSGDPLDLRSKVLAVYIGGRRVPLPVAEANR
jgi:imidazolonepropionase-like amidohydrolase